MRIMFWNTYRNESINKYISCLVRDYKVDILVLAEYVADKKELCEFTRIQNWQLEQYTTIGCDRISIFGNYKVVQPSIQHRYYSIQIINKKFILCGVHLPSDLHGNRERERASLIRMIMDDIKTEENKLSMQNTIIVGDFNEMPYDDGCLNADTFHGLPIHEEASSNTRIVLTNEYKKYYNPMWNFFGDFTYPPGTYYKSNSSIKEPMWYIFDQFILGYDIVPLLIKDQVDIITQCSIGKLMDRNGHPNKSISDHFPIICELLD